MPRFLEEQWLRLKVAQKDKGSYGARLAPAGSMAVVAEVNPRRRKIYGITCWPSGVEFSCSEVDLESLAEPLPIEHPDVPSTKTWKLVNTVGDIYANQAFLSANGYETWNKSAGTISIPTHIAANLRKEAKGSAVEKMVSDMLGKEDGEAIVVSVTQVDAVSAALGRCERFVPAPKPRAKASLEKAPAP